MRVGVNAVFLGKGHNGISTYIRGLIGALRDYRVPHGEEYVIYTSVGDDVPREPNFKWRRVSPLLSHERKTLGNIARLLWTQLVLPGLLVSDRVDILLSPLPESPIVARTPRVVVVHDLIPLFYPEESPRIAHYTRSIVPLFLRSARRIVADSEHTKQDLVRSFGIDEDSISMVHLGVDDCYFSPDRLDEGPPNCPDKYFLFVGACLPRKNPLDVIRAYARVQDRLDERLVLVTSTGAHFNEVEGVVRELGLGDRVVFYSSLPQNQMLFLYRQATALVLLSQYEGFGYPAAEALASGTPAIVSACTSLPEVVGDAGVIVQPGDLQAVAAAMTELALDETLQKRLQERGRLRSEAFRWKHIAKDVRSVLLNTMDGQREDKLSLTTSQD